jgi:hypothetical protein
MLLDRQLSLNYGLLAFLVEFFRTGSIMFTGCASIPNSATAEAAIAAGIGVSVLRVIRLDTSCPVAERASATGIPAIG